MVTGACGSPASKLRLGCPVRPPPLFPRNVLKRSLRDGTKERFNPVVWGLRVSPMDLPLGVARPCCAVAFDCLSSVVETRRGYSGFDSIPGSYLFRETSLLSGVCPEGQLPCWGVGRSDPG